MATVYGFEISLADRLHERLKPFASRTHKEDFEQEIRLAVKEEIQRTEELQSFVKACGAEYN